MRFRKFIIAFILLLSTTVLFAGEAVAQPLDEIQDYNIRVSMRQDGTMDIDYSVKWKVLDSKSEGPLEWVKVGIPNKHVDEIESKSKNIAKIGYLNDEGTYVRVDFDRKYEAGEVVDFSFSIHQSYMYVIDDDEHICRYSFTPGWFDDIEVKHIKIMWKNDNVINSSSMSEDDGYLIWEASLGAGERLNASVEYNLDVFDTNKNQQFEDGHSKNSNIGLGVLGIIIAGAIAIGLCLVFDDDDYYSGSGFRGGSHYHTHYVYHSGGSSRHSCACASHCACACACAGGGRAGCSMKNFYNGNDNRSREQIDETEILLRVLKEESSR